MNKAEAKELMLKYLMPQIEPYGFKAPGKGAEFEIKRKVKSGQDVIVGGFTDYNPIQKIIYSFHKRHDSIIAILKTLEEKGVKLSPPISRHTGTIGSSYSLLHGLNTSEYLPEMETEADVQKCVHMMVEFLKQTAFPLLDKFEDLKEIDKVINGDSPWVEDWDKPYRFGGHFHLKRLIIAKLAGLGSYDRILDFIRMHYSSQIEGKHGDSYKIALHDVEELNKILEN